MANQPKRSKGLQRVPCLESLIRSRNIIKALVKPVKKD